GVSRQLGIRNDPDLAWLASYGRLERLAASPERVSPRDLESADALLAQEPANTKVRLLRAKLYFKAGRLPEAKAALEGLLKEKPGDNQARYGLAVVYEKEGNLPLARAEWERFLQLEPGNAAVQQRLKALR
ncbi:MAG: tetratricopeptide repeat protein, partial [Elusimicrobiota bacterium]|nr:tetratricopeptide repeat protein [Elusimicrobiota bacterium]